jgi:hypothetical protein
LQQTWRFIAPTTQAETWYAKETAARRYDMAFGFFFMADLLGFGNIIRNSTPDQSTNRVARWVELVDQAAAAHQIESIQLISDTVLAAAGDSPEDLRRLVRFGQHLLNDGVPASLPIRGAICWGQYTWGRLTHGKAVVEAYTLEKAQNWIGISCGIPLPHADGLFDFDSLLLYQPPMKAGPAISRAVVDWRVPPANELMNLLGREGLAANGESFTWDLGQKYSYTVLFAIYKELVRAKRLNPRHWHGATGIELVDLHIRGQ